MNLPPRDERSSAAVAYGWASRITAVSLEMVLPGVGGYWLDGWLGVVPVFTMIGFSLGMVLGIWHLLKMTSAESGADRDRDKKSPPTPKDRPPRDA